MKELLPPNAFPHKVQRKGFSPVWVLRCILRQLEFPKLFSHKLHWKGLSPVCILMCFVREALSPKYFPHTVQVNGFSPVMWTLECLARALFCVKVFLHLLQWYGFTPVCTLMCNIKLSFLTYVTPHSSQSNVFLFLISSGDSSTARTLVLLSSALVFVWKTGQVVDECETELSIEDLHVNYLITYFSKYDQSTWKHNT
jgi:hypothetical protein